ncbi:LamG-like jellyroll fold domain-containing protein [Enhygromyxa salina]|uniref:LamG-like jellyroll fold domain-containing protein n=1 Tax=Enhygromyxa salina TaxID=215803 RepID=UPI0015E6D0A0|nr:LamG-like jellyroll fold domain-containing protein [Enhygromyxa salina]
MALASTVGYKSGVGPWTDIELSIGEDAIYHCDAIGYDEMVDVNLNRNTSWQETNVYMCMDHSLMWPDQFQANRPIADLRLIIDGWDVVGGSSGDELCQDIGPDYYQVGGFYQNQRYIGVVPIGSPYFAPDAAELNTTGSWGNDEVLLCAYQPPDSTYILDQLYVAASDDKDEAKAKCADDTFVSVPGTDKDGDPMAWVDLNHDVGGDFIYMCRSRVGRDTIHLEKRRSTKYNGAQRWFSIPEPLKIGHNTSDHARLQSWAFDNLSSFTIALGLELEPMPKSHSSRTLLSVSRNAQSNHLILEYYESDGGLWLTLDGTKYSLGTAALTLGTRHVVAVTKSGSSASAYIDGVLIGSAAVGAFTLDPVNAGVVGEVILGQEQDTMGGGFDANQSLGGTIFSASVYDEALSAAQVSTAQGRWRAGNDSGTTLDLLFIEDTSGIGWSQIDEGSVGSWDWEYRPSEWIPPHGWMLTQHFNAGSEGPIALDGHTPWFGTGQVSDLWMEEGRFSVNLWNGDDDGIGIIYGYRDEDNFYRAEIDGLTGAARITRVVDGEYELLGTGSCGDGLPVSWAFDMEVDISDTADASINHVLRVFGQPCATVNEDEYRGGNVGVWTAWNEKTSFLQYHMSSYATIDGSDDVPGQSWNFATDELLIGDNSWDAAQLDSRAFDGMDDFSLTCEVRLDGLQVSGAYPGNTLLSCANPWQDNAMSYWYEAASGLFAVRINNTTRTFSVSQEVQDAVADGEYHEWGVSRSGDVVSVSFDGASVGVANGFGGPTDVSVCFIGQEQDCDGGCFDSNQSLLGSVDGCSLERG